MRLQALHLRHAPGMPEGMRPIEFGPGLNLVIGPNASGKTTIRHAILGTLWSGGNATRMYAQSRWDVGATTRTATLLHGATTWDGAAPEVPRDAAARYALGLGELLRPGEADRAIARRLAVELSAGYDVDAALGDLTATEATPHGLVGDRERAQRAIRDVQSRADACEAEERRLAGLRRELEDAERASRAIPLAAKVLDLAKERVRLAALNGELAGLPPGLERLRGTEAHRHDELAHDVARARGESATVRSDIESLVTERAAYAFPGPIPDDGELGVAASRARALDQRLAERRTGARELAAAQTGLHAALAQVFTPGERPPDLTDEAIAELERAVAAVRDADGAAGARRALADAWSALDDPSIREDQAKLAAGVAALRGWLQTPAPATVRARRWPAWLPWGLVAAGVLVAGLGIALVVATLAGAGGALAGVGGVVAGVGGALAGAGLALLFPGAASPAAEPDRRVPFVEQAAAAGISPESWELDAVQTRLLALEGRLDVVRVLTIVRTRAAEARATADRAGAELASARNAAVASVATSGLDPRLVPLALAQQAHALAAWAKAAREEAMVRARLDETDRQVAAATDEISRWLREVGVADVASAEDSRVPLVEAVQRRVARLAEIDRALADLNRRAADLDATIATSASELDEIWIRAGVDPDDRAALIARLDQRRTWTQLRADRAGLQSRIEALSAEAEAAAPALGVADPVRLGVAEAEALVARLQEEAAALQSRASEVARIKADIGVAEGGTAWADARTKLAEAEGGLARERESRTEKLLARLVLEDARAAYRTQHASPVLSRAQGWFARFTHGGWRLDVDPAGQGELYAVDTRLDRRRALGELSDATRVQLLLAARLAAIEEQESGSGPIPLCLDEVLSTTDPGRFREVATSALELVRSGRQVLYFTADPAEADHWRAACAEAGADQPRVIDLGSPSGTGEAWGERHRVAPHPAEGVPEPLGDDADAYAQALGVPAPDGFRPLSAWHLVHVLYDDLPALRRCLQRRVDRVGPWREARRTPSAHLLDEPLAKRVDARVRLLGAVLDAWRVGRGRPVTAEDLGASVVSSTFRGRVQELVLSHGRDARAFARAVRDLPRFRSDAADRLEAHLEEQGILDPAEPLDADAIVRRAVAAVAVDVDQGVITAEEAVAFVDGVLGLVGEQ